MGATHSPVVLLAMVLLGAVVGTACDGDTPSTPRRDWALVFYMPYDNDLHGAGPTILNELRHASIPDGVAVVAEVDSWGPGGMVRHVLTRGGARKQALGREASSSAASLRDLLRWTTANLPARRYAVFLLGHGGGATRSGYDANPGEGGDRFMRHQDLARELSAFRRTAPGEVELVFLQQCGRATVEILYELRHTAPVLMASQGLMGAPNAYYRGMVEYLSRQPDADGARLARAISVGEDASMFVDHVVVRTAPLEQLPDRLQPVLEPLLERLDGLSAAAIESRLDEVPLRPSYVWDDQVFFDLVMWLARLYAWLGVDARPLDPLREWILGDVVAFRAVSPPATPEAGPWTGLSLWVPGNEEGLARFEDLSIARATAPFGPLHQRLLMPLPP